MRIDQDCIPGDLIYKAGLDRIQEAVISSHFMHILAKNAKLDLYDENQFSAKLLEIDAKALYDNLIPSILSACNTFCRGRAAAAKIRARANYRKYGLNNPGEVGFPQFITEVMFDRQYLRGPRETCSRELLSSKVNERIEAGAPIEMLIPALPYKFSSPLKTRGRLPDLGEVNFILGLYEIAATIELIYREARPDLPIPLAEFTVVSDGSRFNKLLDEPESVLEAYRMNLCLWIKRLELEKYITVLDYSTLLRNKLPVPIWEGKSAIRRRARAEYAKAMWPIFKPYEMAMTIKAAAEVEPDPECSNPEGRFVSLLTSLIYTINYKILKKFEKLPARDYRALYRELMGHIFEPYAVLSESELQSISQEMKARTAFWPTNRMKEFLRQSMLEEAWAVAIEYIAEIKSDRELEEDPMLTCLPGHFRWTIHAKSGQLAISTPTALGIPVQAWAGSAVFKLTKKNKIKLCTLPVLALEGAGAIPVKVKTIDDESALEDQPLFYIYSDIEFDGLDDFVFKVKTTLERKRTS